MTPLFKPDKRPPRYCKNTIVGIFGSNIERIYLGEKTSKQAFFDMMQSEEVVHAMLKGREIKIIKEGENDGE